MNSKAFTLIELLAVIVILAIIALIAVPIVINIISDSKKSSNEESIKMYGSAIENAAGNYFIKHPEKKNVTVQQLKNEKLVNYNGSIVECEVEKIYRSGKIYLKGCTVGVTKVEYTYGEESYKDYLHLAEDTGEKGLTIGDEYTYDVNDSDTFTFYVLSIEDSQVNLIMDKNICEDGTVDYQADSRYCNRYWGNSQNINGPTSAMSALYTSTKEWANVPNMNVLYDDKKENEDMNVVWEYGYTSLEIIDGTGKIIKKGGTETTIGLDNNKPIKARLPKLSEVISNNVGCHLMNTSSDEGSCPIWMIENLGYENVANDKYSINKKYDNTTVVYNIKGYWLLTSSSSSNKYARAVINYGAVSGGETGFNISYGIRPVITVPISNFE